MKFKDLRNLIQTYQPILSEGKLYIDTEVHSGVQPWDVMVQQVQDILNKKSQITKDEAESIRDIYYKAHEVVQGVEKKLSRILKRAAPKDSKILIDIKQESAFIDKVINRGKSASKITDVLRSAVLVETDDDLDKFIKNLEKYADIYEHEYKAKGEDKNFGYHGSHHFLISIENVLIEVQAMTKRLWTFKNPSHDIYQKWRSVEDFDARIAKKEREITKDMERSRNYFKQGNQSTMDIEKGERLSKYKDIRRGKFAQKIRFT